MYVVTGIHDSPTREGEIGRLVQIGVFPLIHSAFAFVFVPVTKVSFYWAFDHAKMTRRK